MKMKDTAKLSSFAFIPKGARGANSNGYRDRADRF
jgi:hypothetical protein